MESPHKAACFVLIMPQMAEKDGNIIKPRMTHKLRKVRLSGICSGCIFDVWNFLHFFCISVLTILWKYRIIYTVL